MSNPTVKCPNCGHEFEPTDALRESIQEQLNSEVKKWKEEKQKEFHARLEEQQKEADTRIAEQKRLLEKELRQNITKDFENQLKINEERFYLQEEKLKSFRDKELHFMKKEEEYRQKEVERELEIQKRIQEDRHHYQEQFQKQEAEKNQLKSTEMELKIKELEKQLDVQKKLAEEMKRKAEQGSMQMQGEVMEIALEQYLRDTFPLDEILEIGKGVRGADILHIVNDRIHTNMGKIYIESKNTKDFQPSWIEKFKADMRDKGAMIGVLVTKVMPKEMSQFGQREGIWICTMHEFKALIHVLRDAIIRIGQAHDVQKNKGDKMSMLYDYLVGPEFRGHIEAIVEGFSQMKEDLDSEKRRMNAVWNMREKQIEKVLLNTMQLYGSIKGIGGREVIHIKQLEENIDNKEIF
jgi:hypothetical protein